MITVKNLPDFSTKRNVLESAILAVRCLNGFATIRKCVNTSGQIEWQEVVTKEICRDHYGKNL